MPLRRKGPRRAQRFPGFLVNPRFALGPGSCLRRSTFSLNPPQDRTGNRLGVGVEQDLGEHARDRRRHLLGHLVGLELDQRIVLGHRIADLLDPPDNRPFGDRFAHLGHHDISGHTFISPDQ